jgi:hypothetical protein
MLICKSSGVGKVPLIDYTSHMLPYEHPDAFVCALSEFLAKPHRPLTGSTGHTAQNVALDAR